MTNLRFVDSSEFPSVMRKAGMLLDGFSYCLIGGRAFEVYKNPPQTPDLDLLANVTDKDVEALITRGRDIGIATREVFRDLGSPLLFMLSTEENVEIDILGAFSPLHFNTLDTAQRFSRGNVFFPVAKREYLVMLKATATVDHDREPSKVKRDIAALRDMNSDDLDKNYIETELGQNQMADEWALLKRLGII